MAITHGYHSWCSPRAARIPLRGPREAPLGPRELATQVEAVFEEVDAHERAAGHRTLEELVEEAGTRC